MMKESKIYIKENEKTFFETENHYYVCMRKGIYSFTDVNNFSYTVNLELDDVVFFDPFRIERRYEKK